VNNWFQSLLANVSTCTATYGWLGDWVREMPMDLVDIQVPGADGGGGEKRTIQNVLVTGGGVPCECLRQAQNVDNLFTRAGLLHRSRGGGVRLVT
jgi:hypothetical protein